MADQWIEARTARNLFKNPFAICGRCHAGLIRSRADLFWRDDQELIEADLPRQFWWAEGHEALEQDWDAGSFSTWIEREQHWRAFGVRFLLDDLLKLVPFEEHAALRRQLSVAGNPAWVSSREARRFAYSVAGISPTSAGRSILEQCRLGLVSGRAIEMRYELGASKVVEEREWDIPPWFWKEFTAPDSSFQEWENGLFRGRGRGPRGRGSVALHGVHFLRSSLDALLPAAAPDSAEPEVIDAGKPRLPEADLRRWWEKLASVRDALSQNQLWALAKSDHPEHTISRDRIRGLADGRTPGPKPS
jgi:hypothetical protein